MAQLELCSLAFFMCIMCYRHLRNELMIGLSILFEFLFEYQFKFRRLPSYYLHSMNLKDENLEYYIVKFCPDNPDLGLGRIYV